MNSNQEFPKIQKKQKIIYWLCFLLTFFAYTYYIIAAIIGDDYYQTNQWQEKILIVEETPLPQFEIVDIVPGWAFLFYFTSQSNTFVLIYFFLIAINYLKPRQKTTHTFFETFVLINIFITMILFWSLILPQINVAKNFNIFYVIQSFLSHGLVPFLMIFVYSYHVVNFKNNIKILYSDFWKFFVYPFVYLSLSLILYYVTKKDDYSQHFFLKFKNSSDAWKWIDTVYIQEINNMPSKIKYLYEGPEIVNGNYNVVKITAITAKGIALYPFTQVDLNGWKATFFYWGLIIILFSFITFIVISFQNKDYFLNRIAVKFIKKLQKNPKSS